MQICEIGWANHASKLMPHSPPAASTIPLPRLCALTLPGRLTSVRVDWLVEQASEHLYNSGHSQVCASAAGNTGLIKAIAQAERRTSSTVMSGTPPARAALIGDFA